MAKSTGREEAAERTVSVKKHSEENSASGTWAGVAVALVVILLFILAATFLKSLIFGLILAYFFLPLEKFFEHRFFQLRPVKSVCRACGFLYEPIRKLRIRIAGGREPSQKEKAEAERARLVTASTIAALISVFLGLFLALTAIAVLLIPNAMRLGNKMTQWAGSSAVVLRAEKAITKWIDSETSSAAKAPGKVSPSAPPADKASAAPHAETSSEVSVDSFTSFRDFLAKVRPAVREYLQKNYREFAGVLFTQGKGVLSGIISLATKLGVFAFDLLLCVFFFFYFLHGMAYYMTSASSSGQEESVGSWYVRGIFGTNWMPAVSEASRREAVEIIDRIALMLRRWVRGYLWIIIIETVLYITAFSLFSVPYAPLLAMVAGMTILLPFLGPVASFLLTVLVCITFGGPNTAGMLVGVCLTYAVINGIIEQLFLYPSLVGGAIGLTTLETIIVVLLGGLLGGIAGMIFAVPTAAIIKYLIPMIYHVWRNRKSATPSPEK